MQTFLFLFDSFGLLSWLYLVGCIFAGAAFAHTCWAYKQTQILHLRREQSRLRQELALRNRSLSAKPPVSESPRNHSAPQSSGALLERYTESPVQLPARSSESLRVRSTPSPVSTPASTDIHAARTPRKYSLREDRQLGLVFFLAPDEPDPLERLSTITAAQIRDLNMLGVYKFEQIARWNEGNLRSFAILLGVDPQEFTKLGWVHQARVLHGETHGSKMVLAS